MNSSAVHFIVNPGAGKKRDGDMAQTIRNYFPRAVISFTKQPSNAALLAKQAQESGASLIVVGGGDGTVHEVINGLYLPDPNLAIGILPLGTANVLAINLNIPLNPAKALQALSSKAKVMPIDLGQVDRVKFINTVSIGLDAEINEKALALKSKVRKLPAACYLPAILKTTFSSHSWPMISVYLGRMLFYRGETTVVAITNSPTYGLNFPINPKARLDDGKLNLCLLKKIKEIALPYYLLRLTLKRHPSSRHGFMLDDFTTARISATKPVPLQIDGEPAGLTKEINISVLPKMANFLYIPRSS